MLFENQKTVLEKLNSYRRTINKKIERIDLIENSYKNIKILLNTKSSYSLILNYIEKCEKEINSKTKIYCKLKR